MKRVKFILLLSGNALCWIIISALNYIGIYQQLDKDVSNVILYSILIFAMYLMIIHVLSITVARFYNIIRYRKAKMKYYNRGAVRRQRVLLVGLIIYLYVVCYLNADFLGLIPMLLFFGKKYIQIGKFYIYNEKMLIMQDELSREYLVRDINLEENRILLQNRLNNEMKIIRYKVREKEKAFLKSFVRKTVDSQEVA